MSHMRKAEDKRRLKKLFDKTNVYLIGAYMNDKGVYCRWYPYSANVNVKKQFRRISNRKFRRQKLEQYGRGDHKKIFNLWRYIY